MFPVFLTTGVITIFESLKTKGLSLSSAMFVFQLKKWQTQLESIGQSLYLIFLEFCLPHIKKAFFSLKIKNIKKRPGVLPGLNNSIKN